MCRCTEWFHGSSVEPAVARPRSWLIEVAAVVVLAAALALASAYARACDRYVLSGLAKHGEREHHYNSTTWGVGCEYARGDWRWGARLFDNSNDQATLLPIASWLSLHLGPVNVGPSAGVALFGYGRFATPAGALTAEVMAERGAGIDLSLVPRALGMKGAVGWLNFKFSGEPLK